MSAPRFRVGDRIHTRMTNPAGHTRLPAYLRNRSGVIDAVLGQFHLPDESARGSRNVPKETLYSVAFRSGEVWGSDAGEDFLIYADLMESYLE